MAPESPVFAAPPIPSDSVDARRRHARAAIGVLTRRELQVLHAVSEGYPDREIAAFLFISQRTVTWHVTNVLNKLGVTSRTAAAVQAVRRGWL